MLRYKRVVAFMVLIFLGLYSNCERSRSFEVKVVSPEGIEGIKVFESEVGIGSTDSSGILQSILTRKKGGTLVFSYEKEGYQFAQDTVATPEQKDESLELTIKIIESNYKKVILKFTTIPSARANIEVYEADKLLGRTDLSGNLEVTRLLKKGDTVVFSYVRDSVPLETTDVLVVDPYIQEFTFKVEIPDVLPIRIMVAWTDTTPVPEAAVTLSGYGLTLPGQTNSRGEVVYYNRNFAIGQEYSVSVNAAGISMDTTLVISEKVTRVALYLRKPLSLNVTFHWDDDSPAVGMSVVLESGAFRLEKVTDSLGKAVFTYLSFVKGDSYQVYIPGIGDTSSLTVRDQGGDFGPFKIPRPLSIMLTFLDESGAPLPNARVILESTDQSMPRESKSTDNNGQVNFTDQRLRPSITYRMRFTLDPIDQGFGITINPNQRIFEQTYHMVTPGEIVLTFRWDGNNVPLRSTEVRLTGGNLGKTDTTDSNGAAIFRSPEIQKGRTYHFELRSGLTRFERDITLPARTFKEIFLIPRFFHITIRSSEPKAEIEVYDLGNKLIRKGTGYLELDLNPGSYRVQGRGTYNVSRAFSVEDSNASILIRTDTTAFELGRIASENGNCPEARSYWSTVESSDENFSEAVFGLIQCLEIEGDTTGAFEAYQQYFVDRNPNKIKQSPMHQFEFGLLNFFTRKFAKANEYFGMVQYNVFPNVIDQHRYQCWVQYYTSLCFWEIYRQRDSTNQFSSDQERVDELERIEREMNSYLKLYRTHRDSGLDLSNIQGTLDQVQAEIRRWLR